MIRTLISLAEKDKRWLDSYSRRHGQSAAQTVREAIRRLRDSDAERAKEEIVAATAGMWSEREADGMDYVDRMRDEW